MPPISKERQPEPTPIAGLGTSPSLWLYLALILAAAGLTGLAFAILGKTDWPGLLLNLAAGLIGSVVILIVIDRRLRVNELDALRRFPAQSTLRLAWLVFPTRRASIHYVRGLLVVLEPLIAARVELAAFQNLEAKVRTGFVLLAEAGNGKTTWTQFAAVRLSHQFLDGRPDGRIPILFPMARWLPDRSLYQALYETFNSYASCGRRVFDRILLDGSVVVLLDGYDELWTRHLPFDDEIGRLRAQFPRVALTLTSRPDKPTPEGFGETISLGLPTGEELAAIHRRL